MSAAARAKMAVRTRAQAAREAQARAMTAVSQRVTALRARIASRPASTLGIPPTLDALRAQGRRRRALRTAMTIAAVIALLLLLLQRCDSAPPEPIAAICPEAPECGTDTKTPPKPQRNKPRAARIDPTARGAIALDATPPPAWLSDLQLQVTARSRELARCFDGSEKPGALRWSTTVNPRLGSATDSELSPVLRAPALNPRQELCVLSVLSRPYRLPIDEDHDVGARVSLVIEF